MASVKSNVILNAINTLSGIIYPFITFPYAARVLLPDGIGTINFLNSIIAYIVLVTNLGIPIYAVKEVAKVRDNIEQRNKLVIEIIILSLVLCLIGYIIVFVLACRIPQIHSQSKIFFVLSLSIIFNAVGVNWFYQGIENFKYITVRALIVRTLAATSLFVFVKTPADLLFYAYIVVGATVGNNFLNFLHLNKYISVSKDLFRGLSIYRHIKPAFLMFIVNIIISLYVQLNSVMLGFMSGETSVGLYTAGTKISHIGLTMITSLGIVLLPRCSNLVKKGDLESFSVVIKKSLDITSCLSIPMAIGLMILASPVIYIFCGDAFMDSVPILIISAPIIWIASLTNIMGVQVLYPLEQVKIVMYSVIVGASINILCNIILISSLHAVGAAISALLAEIAVLTVQIIYGKQYFPFRIKDIIPPAYFLTAIIMSVFVFLIIQFTHTYITKLIFGTICGAFIYFGVLILFKDRIVKELLSSFKLIIKQS